MVPNSWSQVICQPQPPKVLGLQVQATSSSLGDVYFDHFIEIVFVKFLHYKMMIVPFVITKYLLGRYFDTMEISYFLYLCPLILSSINSSLQQLLAVIFALVVIICFHHFFYIY